MSTSWSRRIKSCVAVFGFMVIVLDPGILFGQAVQDGKWKVPSGITKNIFFNGSGATQRVMITVCAVSGGDVNLELQGSALYNGISVPECVTVTGSIASGNLARIGNGSGQNASGTYSLAVLP